MAKICVAASLKKKFGCYAIKTSGELSIRNMVFGFRTYLVEK